MLNVGPSETCETCASPPDWEARRPVTARLASLEIGDFFHAAGVSRGGLVCLVVKVADTTIVARQVPSAALVCTFDRVTGDRLQDDIYTLKDGPCRIDSVEPLPVVVHLRLLDMDRQGRLRPLENRLPGRQQKNWQAMLRAYEHYADHAFGDASEHNSGHGSNPASVPPHQGEGGDETTTSE